MAPIVYVVEDDDLLRPLIARILAKNGLEAHVFATAFALGSHLEGTSEKPAAALVDANLSRRDTADGAGVVAKLLERFPDLVVIGMSGREENAQAMLAAGAKHFLKKPFSIAQLRDILEKLGILPDPSL